MAIAIRLSAIAASAQLLSNALYSIGEGFPSEPSFDLDKDGYIDNIVFIIQGHPMAGRICSGTTARTTPHGNTPRQGYRRLQFCSQREFLCHRPMALAHCATSFSTLWARPDLYHYSYDGFVPVGKWDLMESNAHPPNTWALT
jgi:hypothetical protein